MRPKSLIVRALLVRGLAMWIGARVLAALVFMFAQIPVTLTVEAAIDLVVVAVALGFIDVGRRRERALLANLGIGATALAACLAAPAACGELSLRLLAAIL